MRDMIRFNNTWIFLILVTTLIVPFFLSTENIGDREAHSEEWSSSRTLMSINLAILLRICYSSDLGTVYAGV
jgi:hypothetical protein